MFTAIDWFRVGMCHITEPPCPSSATVFGFWGIDLNDRKITADLYCHCVHSFIERNSIWVLGDIITFLTIIISQHIYAITVHSFIERNSIWVLGDIITILTMVK